MTDLVTVLIQEHEYFRTKVHRRGLMIFLFPMYLLRGIPYMEYKII